MQQLPDCDESLDPTLDRIVLDRRAFLSNTAGGGAALALASFFPAGCSADYPHATTDGAQLHSLTDKEYAITRAAAEALLIGVPVEAKTVAGRIDRELAAAGNPMRADFKTVLGLIEHLTPLGGHMHRFTRLKPADRLAYLNGWGQSRFALRRAAFFALKGFITYFAYVEPATRGITRFAGPWPERLTVAARPVDFGSIA